MTSVEFLRHAMIIADYLDEDPGCDHPITLAMYDLIITVLIQGVVIPEAPADEG